LPAAAEAARERRFDDPAIATAVEQGRLVVTRTKEEDMHATIIDIVRTEQAERRSVSVFTHTNAATAAVSDALTDAGLQHEQVGMGEAYAEALSAQLALIRFAIEGVSPRRPLAVYVAANYRARVAIVSQIMEGSNAAFERAFERVLHDLETTRDPALDLDTLGKLVTGAYGRLGTQRGQQTWLEAARRTRMALSRIKAGTPFASVAADIERARHNSLVGDGGLRPRRLQVMNLHQTKGREADATILLLQPDEFHGRERTPFPKLSRLMYVVLTRARKRAHLVVPPEVHALWEPLIEICEAHSR
jgi:DNA helicase-2/ATP-dependent DNA helicase PcrA